MTEPAHCKFCDPDRMKDLPFVFSELLEDGTEIWSVECGYCDARGPVRMDREDAVMWWNKVMA